MSSILVQVIVGGLLLGAVYALFSSGLTLIWGMMNVVNFAHGDFVMLAMYAAFYAFTLWHLGPIFFVPGAALLLFVLGVVFGASSLYLVLKVGLTVSASIPIAVLAISVLKKLGGSTILENNIVQTIGSAGESVAGGVVFTIPALIFLTPDGPAYFNYYQIAMLAFAGLWAAVDFLAASAAPAGPSGPRPPARLRYPC